MSEFVELSSPYGYMSVGSRGERIPNGTRGEVVGLLPSGAAVVNLEGWGRYTVPQHWLKILIPVQAW
jgi:hypothetical protein